MIRYILKQSFTVIKNNLTPVLGISLLYMVICAIISALGAGVPILWIPAVLTLSAGMAQIYLNKYDGTEPVSKHLFAGFKRELLPRIAGGMCWYWLWAFIWSFVPVAGIIKMYSYRFTPYILMTRPEINAMETLTISRFETKGYKFSMFLADSIIAVPIALIIAVFIFLSAAVSTLFIAALILFVLAAVIFIPVYSGIVSAAFYREVKNGSFTASAALKTNARGLSNSNKPSGKEWQCECGTYNVSGTRFCSACGKENK